MRFNPERHHRRSIRIPGYDYVQAGAYFVTIVSQDRQCIFGMIQEESIILNEIGGMIEREWQKLSRRFRRIEVLDYVIMPNHLHGILMILGRGTGANETDDSLSRNTPRAPTLERFGAPVLGSLPTIIRSFKSSTTLRYRLLLKNSDARLWQRNYYEHIIRDEADLNRIRIYILCNPARWEEDRENPAK